MANNVIAFLGMDFFDHIIYLASILIKLDKKVLLIDHSDTLALKNTIPQPQGVSCSNEIISYRGFDFTTMRVSQKMLASYDDIFISCGFQEPEEDVAYCNRIIFATDPYRYNHLRIRELATNCHIQGIKNKELIIKDMIESKITTELVCEHIGITFPQQNISLLFREDRDYYNGVLCHTNGSFAFRQTSKQLKKYLIKEIAELYPQIKLKQIYTACRQAGKGVN